MVGIVMYGPGARYGHPAKVRGRLPHKVGKHPEKVGREAIGVPGRGTRLGDLWRDFDPVFSNRVCKPLDYNNLYYRDYKPFPKIVQPLLGYSSITQTMDTYSHLMEGMGDDAVNRLDDAFGT